jgi:hypothetical protein
MRLLKHYLFMRKKYVRADSGVGPIFFQPIQFPFFRILTVPFDSGTNLSSSSYFLPCNISVILIVTGMIRDLPIVCGFLAFAIKYDTSCDSLSTFLVLLCVVLSTLPVGRGFSISSQ